MLATIVINAGAAAAAAAAAAERRRREEEEEMTPYSGQELHDSWEFKIIRANTMAFDKPDVFRRMLAEEAECGWQLVEKFDGARVRLKRRRPTSDDPYGRDPYRTTYGVSAAAIVGLVFLGMGVFLSLVIALIVLFNR